VIILIVVLINAIVGVIQDPKPKRPRGAEKALVSQGPCCPRRHAEEIPAEEVVPGELVVVDAVAFSPVISDGRKPST